MGSHLLDILRTDLRMSCLAAGSNVLHLGVHDQT